MPRPWLVALGLLLVVAAPASAQRRGSTPACEPATLDSLPLRPDSLYRNCDVDTPARRRGSPPRPSFTFPRQIACAVIEFDAVVDVEGRILPGSVRVLMATTPEFRDAVIATLPRWRYTPAKKGDVAVAQAVHERYALGDGRVPFTVVTTSGDAGGTAAGRGGARLPAGPSGRPSGSNCD